VILARQISPDQWNNRIEDFPLRKTGTLIINDVLPEIIEEIEDSRVIK
jgi:hypothetical protein